MPVVLNTAVSKFSDPREDDGVILSLTCFDPFASTFVAEYLPCMILYFEFVAFTYIRAFNRFGAEVVENRASHSRSGQSQIFGGTGYRLGETGSDSEG